MSQDASSAPALYWFQRSRHTPSPVSEGLHQPMGSACSSRLLSVMALIVGGATYESIAPTAEDWDQDWTVVTMARDDSWGVGIDFQIAGANAAAIRECRTMSGGGSEGGAELAAVRGGWIMGLRCDDYRILVTGKDRKEAEATALNREIDLKELYVPDLPACRQVLTVAPRGAAVTASSHLWGRP